MKAKALYIILFTALIAYHPYATAQNKLILCTNYDKDGSITGDYQYWNIQENGNYMYVFLRSASDLQDTVSFELEKTLNREDTTFYKLDNYYLVTDPSRKWAVNKYIFTKSGRYRISAYDQQHKLLAPPLYTYIDFVVKAYDDIKFADTWYYNSSDLQFYERTVKDSLFGRNTTFSINNSEVKVTAYVEQKDQRPFKSQHIYLKVFTDDDCKKLEKTDVFFVNEKWYWTYLPIVFNKKGKYVVKLYNDDDVFIASGNLEIK